MQAQGQDGGGPVKPERPDGEIERAEPDTELHCPPVLRSNVVSNDDAQGPGAVRREAPPAPGPSLDSFVTTPAESVGDEWAFMMGVLKSLHFGGAERLGHRWAWKCQAVIRRLGWQEWCEAGWWWSKGLQLSDGCG